MTQSMPMTKYHQIYLVLREQLLEGKFEQGLPGELALMQQFGVARVTVRRALEQLASEGMILREAGRGTRPMEGAVYAESIPIDETRDYVKRVMTASLHYDTLLGRYDERTNSITGAPSLKT